MSTIWLLTFSDLYVKMFNKILNKMHYYILDNSVVGDNADPDNIPNGWLIAEFDNHDTENLYYDGSSIQLKPPKISANSYWSTQDMQWLEYEYTGDSGNSSIQQANYIGLMDSLRNTAVFAKAYDAGSKTIKANAAFSLLMTALTASRNLNDLRFSLAQLRDAMQSQASLSDFTDDELSFIKKALTDNGFSAEDFDLSVSL